MCCVISNIIKHLGTSPELSLRTVIQRKPHFTGFLTLPSVLFVFRIPQRSGFSERMVFVYSVFTWVLRVTAEVYVFLVVGLVTS